MRALYTFLQGSLSYADATKLPASTSDDVVVVLKKELSSPKKSQGNGCVNQRSWKTVCPLANNVKFVITQSFNEAGELPPSTEDSPQDFDSQ